MPINVVGTVIGAGTHIEGGLRSKDDLQVEGRVDGAVAGEAKVALFAGAEIGGDVSGSEVTIGCVLKHNVRASQSVHLLATAEVYGEIRAPRIVVDDGAILEGQVKITRATPTKDERRKGDSPMRQIAASPPPAPPTPRERKIPELPVLGKRVATRRK